MKEVVTSPGIGTAMLDAGSTTTIGIGGAIGISESAIMAEGGSKIVGEQQQPPRNNVASDTRAESQSTIDPASGFALRNLYPRL